MKPDKNKVTMITPISEIGSPQKLQHQNTYTTLTKGPSFAQNCIYYIAEYSENATIHGLKYVAERGRSLVERICWTVVIIAALCISIVFIWNIYQKWVTSPVIVAFATSETPIFDIPFPAVTICPEVKSDMRLFNYTDIYLKKKANRTVTANESKYFEYMSLVCITPPSLLNQNVTVIDEEAIDYIIKASPQLKDYVYEVEWEGIHFYDNYSSLFSPILTSEGLCYTFNMLDGSELFTDIMKYPEGCYSTNGQYSKWSPEAGYDADADLDAYPRRTLVAGVKGGLRIKLRFFKEHIDHACGNSLQGYKAMLHQPSEMPRVKHNYFRVPLGQAVVAAIKPNIMVTTPELRNYDVQDRKCYFDSEKLLRFFKIYDQQNCLVECLANFTLNLCGCTDFHMPREDSTPICGAAKYKCANNARVAFLLNEMPLSVKEDKMSKLNPKYVDIIEKTHKCDCLPACHSISFDVETSQTSGKWKETLFIAYEAGDVDESYHTDVQGGRVYLTELTLFFKSMQFITAKRNALYGHTDFWANVGGIMGLFTGFSFISMFEILYYLTLRIYCNAKRFGSRYWSGAPQLLDRGRITPKK